MIRVVTVDEYEPAVLKQLTKILYTAFGVGSEHAGNVNMPAGQQEPFDAHKLLAELPPVTAFEDDKVVYLTNRKLAPRRLQSGEAPTFGLSQYGGQRAVVSSAHIKNVGENVRLLARFILQEVGHTFGLHHCLDPRCAMYPHWTPSFLAGDATFCTFCRDVSEQRIRLTKS